jgi:hypothetical protein
MTVLCNVARPKTDDLRPAPANVLLPLRSRGGQPRQTERSHVRVGYTRSTIMSPAPTLLAPWTEISLGAHVVSSSRHQEPAMT